MLFQLLLTNADFAVKVLAAAIFFATGWLHFDSWQLQKSDIHLLVRSLGFFLLFLVAFGQSTQIDLPLLVLIIQVIKLGGLIAILASLVFEPMLSPPQKTALVFSPLILLAALMPISTVLFLIIALTYFRKCTQGYEIQKKSLAVVFLLFAISEFINISFFVTQSPIVFWSKALSEFGPVWLASNLVYLVGVVILGIWTWGYLRFKAQAQFFIIFVASSLVIFTTTTFLFTFLLLKNLENDALSHLKTDAQVLQYALDRLRFESLANAKVVSESLGIKEAFLHQNQTKLYDESLKLMLSQETSFLDIATYSGKVVARAEDKDKIGDSLSENIVVKRALEGISLATVAAKEDQLTPEIQIQAATPIIDSDKVIGAVMTGFKVDSVFVDGIKQITGLDVAIFSGDTRVATTFTAPDGKSRFVGTKESNQKILATVFEKGEKYLGPAQIFNQPFYTVYMPLKNADDQIIGMMFVGKPQTELFQVAEHSIQLTFLGSVLLMMLSAVPAYYAARYIRENLKA